MKKYDDFIDYVDQATPCAPANSQKYPWFPNEFFRGNDPWLYHCPYPNEYAPIRDGYSLVGDMLSHIYGDIKDAVEPDGEILSLEQLQFVDDPDIKTVDDLHKHGIGETMYVYMPKACKADPEKCDKLHVALHGCQQFPEWTFTGKVGTANEGQNVQFNDLFYRGPYNGIAEANGIIVLYPQAYNIGTSQDDINPYGCWGFWPFYEKDQYTYYTQEGTEMRMIKAMVDHFTSGE